MIKVPKLMIKQKQAFSIRGPVPKILGNAVDVCKNLDAKLIHIIDKDALAGSLTNFDVYDRLTYNVNVQVEIKPSENMIKKLIAINCRVVVPPIDLSSFDHKNRFVATISKDDSVPIFFRDVLIEDFEPSCLEKFKEKRIMAYVQHPKIWAYIYPI